MAQPMPADNPFLNGAFGPIQMECDAPDLYIEGEMPRELSGTFYRAGPNQRFRPRGEYHFFAGDGMVHAFHIHDGQVRYNNRWVRTAKWNIENKEKRAVINAMNPFDCEPEYSDFVLTDKEGLANTAVLWHGDRLLVMEEGHRPFEIDPHTLESIGSWDFRGKLHTAMTAHPKVDPKTGELIFFAYMAGGPFASNVAVHKASDKGILTESILIETPYSSMVHDFVITDNYIVIPVMPITGDLERAMSGKPPFAWEPEKGVHVGVLPRNGGADDIRWFEMDLNFVFHFMNAFDRDGVITVDACQFNAPPLFPFVDGSSTGQTAAYLHRWTIDMNDPAARVVSTKIDTMESEFPQCDPRSVGSEYRHGWYTCPDGNAKSGLEQNDSFYNQVAHFDHSTGKAQYFSFGQSVTSEAIFVPRSADSAEGDGFLMSVVTSLETNTSALYVFDALSLAQGPLAIARLSHRVPAGFHGGWRQN